MSELLPLFPLQLVLLPETPLPLHIYEPRYREMVAECLALKRPFGVVRAHDDGFAKTGCAADIVDVSKRYDDGRLDIMTLGQERFEVAIVDRERAFLRGEVSFFSDDEKAASASSEQRKHATDLQRELITLSGETPGELPSDHPRLSFQLAAALPLDLDLKQALLSMRSEAERLTTLIYYYEALLPKLRRAIKTRVKSSGNGHVM